MAHQGPDSGYSWVIVVCCAYIHFAFFGLFRSSGLVYVALLQNYDVTREEASWPFALCTAVFQLVGPCAGVLTHYMSQRKACLLGSAIATFGIGSCYFADSVMWINVFYGLIHGTGFGFVVTLVAVTLNQYFVKYRATALGIAFSGGAMSSLIFPPIMEWLLENYTLKDSFLLLSGVVMNSLVASSLLRAPAWMEKPQDVSSKHLEGSSEGKDSGVSASGEVDTHVKEKSTPVVYELNDNCDTAIRESSLSKDNSETDKTLYQISDIADESHQDLSESQMEDYSTDLAHCDTIGSNNDSVLFDGSINKSSSVLEKTRESEVIKPLISDAQTWIVPKKNLEQYEKHELKLGIRHSIRDILKQPIFHLITFTMVIYFLGVHSFFIVIVDFAKDKGIPEAEGIYLISMFSLTDLMGRAGLGWITDRNIIRRKTMVAFNLCVLGILYQLFPVVHSLSGMLVLVSIAGLAVGSSITLFFVLQAECLDINKLTLVIGLTSFINGVMSLLRPGIIGLFRDVIGSYNWMFHFIGAITLVFSFVWLLESWKTRERRKTNRIHSNA